ncbi:hypothetical protein LguiA_032201 [Lonicera macranthoides]
MSIFLFVYPVNLAPAPPSHHRNKTLASTSRRQLLSSIPLKMIDDQDLGFIANFLGIFIFVLVIAYHYVTADPKYEGN